MASAAAPQPPSDLVATLLSHVPSELLKAEMQRRCV